MHFKKFIVATGFKLLARGLVSCSKVEKEIRRELTAYEDDFTIELKVFNTNTKVAVKKSGDRFVYLGKNYDVSTDLSIIFKSYESALLLILGKIGLHDGYSQHRFIVKGDFLKAMPLVRILYYVEAYLFPNFINRKILKEIPQRSSTKISAYLRLLGN